MKKIALLLLITIFSVNAFAVEEGVDYSVLKNPIPNKEGTLIKISSYDCPYCYAYDNSVTTELMQKLDGVLVFEPWYLKEKGQFGRQFNGVLAALLAKDQKAGIGIFDEKSTYKKALFGYYEGYHKEKKRWSSQEEFISYGLDKAGVSMKEYETLVKDANTQTLLKTWDNSLLYAQIRGVPMFIIDGKYIMHHERAKSLDELAKLAKDISKVSK